MQEIFYTTNLDFLYFLLYKMLANLLCTEDLQKCHNNTNLSEKKIRHEFLHVKNCTVCSIEGFY